MPHLPDEAFPVLNDSGYINYIPSTRLTVPAEKEAYNRFTANNPPSSILGYHGTHKAFAAGIILDLAERGNIYEFLCGASLPGAPSPPPESLYLWAGQAAEGLAFAHSVGLLNSDIHGVNFFLDKVLNLKVGDWAGASIDGSRSHSTYRWKYRLIAADGTDLVSKGISVQTEIFAGSEDRPEIRKRTAEKKFPDTRDLVVLGEVVTKCWNVEFDSMDAVVQAMKKESGAFRPVKEEN